MSRSGRAVDIGKFIISGKKELDSSRFPDINRLNGRFKPASRFIVISDAGFEVVYAGIYNTPESFLQSALQEGVDAIGCSFLGGEHLFYVRKLTDEDRGGFVQCFLDRWVEDQITEMRYRHVIEFAWRSPAIEGRQQTNAQLAFDSGIAFFKI
jgi:hypothetical protein